MNVLFPSQGELQTHSDAVVSLAPQYHRLATAERLLEAGHADTLVISYFAGDASSDGSGGLDAQVPVSDYCEDGGRDGIVCLTPEEVATIGEASTVGTIASAESWNSLTVVTRKSHAFRARYIFEHCLGADIDVNFVYSDPDLSAAQWVWNIAYENAAFVKAVLQTGTGC